MVLEYLHINEKMAIRAGLFSLKELARNVFTFERVK